MSEVTPKNWQYRSLSALGIYANGFAFNELYWSEHGLPIVRIAQITGSQGIVDRYPGRLPDTFRIDNGDLIFSWSGTLAVVRWDGGPAWLNQHLFKVLPAPIVDRAFLFHLLQASVAEMDKRTHGSTMKHIKRRELREFFVPLPVDRDEQRKIAQILDTLDTAIHETEALLAKLKAVKQGLLHDLLTRGIAANGELRPPQTEAPHLYKLSPLGWIPKEWDHPLLGELLTRIDAGWSPSCPEDPPAAGEWGVLKVSAISSGIFDPQESKRLPSNLKPIPSIEVHTGDVLLARANGVADFVATTVLVHETPSQLMLSDKTLRLVPDENHVIANHLARAMAHGSTRKQINGMLNGSSGQRNISQGQIRRLCIPLPSLLEQRISENRATEIEKRVKAESMTLTKLISLKSGLMDDLLTGRVRVTPLLEAAAP